MYGDYAAALLGDVYFFSSQHDKAVQYLTKVAMKDDFAFADEALYYLIKAHITLGDIALADTALARLRSRYPRSPYMARAHAMRSQVPQDQR